MSTPKDHRGRHGNGSRSNHSSTSGSGHRWGPYDVDTGAPVNVPPTRTSTATAPTAPEGSYRRDYVRSSSGPSARPTMVVDMMMKASRTHGGTTTGASHDDDEVLARKLQREIDAEFAVPNIIDDDDDLPPPPPPTRSSHSRYDIAPVENTHLPFNKRNNNNNHSRNNQTNSFYMNKYREQDEYAEYYKRSMNAGAGAGLYSTANNDVYNDEADLRLARQLQDEELARQLQAQQEEEAKRRRRAERQARRATEAADAAVAAATAAAATTPAWMTSTTTTGNSTHGNRTTPSRSSDVILTSSLPSTSTKMDSRTRTASMSFSDSSSDAARRIAQELDDAEIAQGLAQYEHEVARRNDSKGSSGHLIFNRLLPLFCCAIGVSVGLLFAFGVFSGDDVKNGWGSVFDGKDDWVDPFAGDVNVGGTNQGGSQGPTGISSDQMKWPTDGNGGLQMQILNAMEDRWEVPLQTAISNWDQGFPIDSLTLSITRVAYEAECVAEVGYIKICNANYGATRWRGLNDISFNDRTNEIIKSAAKMNEYYLSSESDDQKLYTVCHEIGHGFGLPHWDEDFFNKDLGNCMDYTNNPSYNMRPSASNFNFLAELYGGLNLTSGETVTAASVIAANAGSDVFSSQEATSTNSDDNARRMLEQLLQQHRHLQSRVLFLDEHEQTRPRRVLFANDHFEVHHVVKHHEDRTDHADDADHVHLQFYLMA